MENFGSAPEDKVEEVELTRTEIVAQIVVHPENTEILGQYFDQLQIRVEKGKMTDLAYVKEIADTYVEAAKQNPDWQEMAEEALVDVEILENQTGG